MRTRSKLLFVGLIAAIGLMAAVGTASANRLSVSSRTFTAIWRPLRFTGFGGAISVTCSVTISGSFHSATIAKVRGALIGHINRATLDNSTCAGGSATILQASLPWHVRYDSFAGTLPNISRVRLGLVGAAFLLNVGASCLYRSTAASPAFGNVLVGAGGAVTGLEAESGAAIPLQEGGFLCPAGGNFTNTGAVTPAITVRLI